MNTPQDLFHDYLDGDLSPDDLQRLEAWLAEDQAHAIEFFRWASLQSLTFETLKGEYLKQVLEIDSPCAALADACNDPAGSIEPRVSLYAHPLPPRQSRAWWVAAAASIILATLAVNLFRAPVATQPTVAQTDASPSPAAVSAEAAAAEDENAAAIAEELANAAANEPSIVATLTRLEDCVWSNPDEPLAYGQQLSQGARIELAQGVARITFESGAVATLEGPCDFVVDNAMHGTIRRGRVSVNAPRRAYGFRIRSPNSEVIDLGTEFGVAVNEGGQSEVHVFSGQVLSRTLDEAGERPGKLFRLKANDGLVFTSADRRPSKIASDTSLFPNQKTVPPKLAPGQKTPLGDKLALWLAADISAQTVKDRHIFAWSDILFGDNLSAEDAFQAETSAQPVLSKHGINGKPAVRFNGTSSYLVTTPLETTDNQTIFMVCKFGKGAERPGRKRGGQLLNYNGPPHRLVSSTYEPGVLQIGEPIVEGFAPTRLGGKLFAGRIDDHDVSEAEMYSSPLGVGQPVVLAYRYDLANNMASLWINGQLIDEKAALRPAGVTSRKVIGRHGFMKFFFAGDIAELLIYNDALPTKSLEEVSHYLGEKYAIPLTGPAAAQ